MKTLEQFLPDLFLNFSGTMDDVTGRLQNLGTISANTSTFQNMINTAKLVNCEVDSSTISTNIFEQVENIDGDEFTIGSYYEPYEEQYYTHDGADETNETMYQLLLSLYNKTDVNRGSVIGYVEGQPVYVWWTNVSGDVSSRRNVSLEMCFYLGKPVTQGTGGININPLLHNRPFLFLRYNGTSAMIRSTIISKSHDTKDPFNFKMYYVQAQDVDTFVGMMTLESICNKMFNDYISNSCIQAIIRRAQSDGVISRDQIESILDQYQTTDVTSALRTMIAGFDKFSHVSVIALIGKLYSIMDAHYTSGDAFQVYDSVNYIRNVIQAIVSLVVSLIATILSILFRVIGVIISVAVSLIQQLFGFLNENVVKTESKIVAESLVPIINNPLLTFDVSKDDFNDWTRTRSLKSDTIDEIIQEYGCAMITPYFQGSAPWYFWILPKDDENYTIQVLLTVAHIDPAYHINDSYYPGTYWCHNISYIEPSPSSKIYFCDLQLSKHVDFDDDVQFYHGCPDLDYKYITDNDKQLRKAVIYNLMSFIDFLNSYTSTGTENFTVYAQDILNSNHDYVDNDKLTIQNILEIFDKSTQYATVSSFDYIAKLKFLAYMYKPYMARILADNYSVEPPTWDEIEDVMNLLRDNISSVKSQIGSVSYIANTMAPIVYLPIQFASEGTILATPSVEWPDLSRSSLVTALLVTGVICAAITAAAVVTKVGLKKVAFNKLADRQAKFDVASDEYTEMKKVTANPDQQVYSDADIARIEKAYYKANKRLTRAWNFAGKFGLTKFNGFDTSSNDISFKDASTNPLSSVCNSDTLASLQATGNTDTNSSISTTTLYHLIVG